MPGGRPCKYDWEDKKDICYTLYVEQKKSPRDIVKYFAAHFGCAESELPGPRLFTRQFSEKWHFPPRKERLKGEDEKVVVERIRQLWEQNLGVGVIRETLEEEGWELGDNEFARLRKQNGYRRRAEVGAYQVEGKVEYGMGGKKKRKRAVEDEGQDEGQDAAGLESGDGGEGGEESRDGTADALLALQQQSTHDLSPEEQARRAEHLARVQLESDQALQTRKRRRRIRGYGHLPPDDPALPPRYGSETTLDECKAFLHLTNDTYTTIRASYEAICHSLGIDRKKDHMASGLWQASKDQLVRENMHLSAIMHPLQPALDKKAIALDVICADVTKRMRDSGKKITVADANNTLGLNPSESKELRRHFYDILTRDQYTTRLACGDAHWAELRGAWFATSEVLQRVAAEAADPQKMKCVDVLCRDATKRYNDDALKRDPGRRQYAQTTYGPGPGSCKANRRKETPNAVAPPPAPVRRKGGGVKATSAATTAAATATGAAQPQPQPQEDANIDPSLFPPSPPPPPPPLQLEQYQQPMPIPATTAIPAYFRLDPSSHLVTTNPEHPQMWLGALSAPTIPALHAAALSRAGGGSAGVGGGGAVRVTKVQGVVRNAGGGEDNYQIDEEGELGVYLEETAVGGKRVFWVGLVEG